MNANRLRAMETLAAEFDLKIEGQAVHVAKEGSFRRHIDRLAAVSATGDGDNRFAAQYLLRGAASAMGVYPASIHALYLARGRGEVAPNFTVPAINLRVLTFDAARAVFRVAKKLRAGAFIFEIARSEMGYTGQEPNEYAASVLAAAIAEGYEGPVFLQGDHFQVSAKRYEAAPSNEVLNLRQLIHKALRAGFYNIDIDTSTLVDLSQPTEVEQQTLNSQLTAMFTAFIRTNEPEGVTASIGGEIGEVGSNNSTEADLRAFMDGYIRELAERGGPVEGISKISIQTGTSHGGTVLPDGTIAKAPVDFEVMRALSRVAREEYSLGGAVQHGASTLPLDAFSQFVDAGAVEIHLATNFQNIFFEQAPADLRQRMYAYLDENHAGERKGGQTDEQFYYKTRKYAIGPFKQAAWGLSDRERDRIADRWEDEFRKLFQELNIARTADVVQQWVPPAPVIPDMEDYWEKTSQAEDVSDLAD